VACTTAPYQHGGRWQPWGPRCVSMEYAFARDGAMPLHIGNGLIGGWLIEVAYISPLQSSNSSSRAPKKACRFKSKFNRAPVVLVVDLFWKPSTISLYASNPTQSKRALFSSDCDVQPKLYLPTNSHASITVGRTSDGHHNYLIHVNTLGIAFQKINLVQMMNIYNSRHPENSDNNRNASTTNYVTASQSISNTSCQFWYKMNLTYKPIL
jgi:hypothetical protein